MGFPHPLVMVMFFSSPAFPTPHATTSTAAVAAARAVVPARAHYPRIPTFPHHTPYALVTTSTPSPTAHLPCPLSPTNLSPTSTSRCVSEPVVFEPIDFLPIQGTYSRLAVHRYPDKQVSYPIPQ